MIQAVRFKREILLENKLFIYHTAHEKNNKYIKSTTKIKSFKILMN